MPLIVISGGGTGGHIYPAVGLAQSIVKLEPETKICFIGGANRLESTIIPQHGFCFLPISVAGFPRRLTWKMATGSWKGVSWIHTIFAVSWQTETECCCWDGGICVGTRALRSFETRNINCYSGTECVCRIDESPSGTLGKSSLSGISFSRDWISLRNRENYWKSNSPADSLVCTLFVNLRKIRSRSKSEDDIHHGRQPRSACN